MSNAVLSRTVASFSLKSTLFFLLSSTLGIQTKHKSDEMFYINKRSICKVRIFSLNNESSTLTGQTGMMLIEIKNTSEIN